MPEVTPLSFEELKSWMDAKKKFLLVEVLPEEEYAAGHIPGAVNMPAGKIEKLSEQLFKKDDTVVLYCRDINCGLSPFAASYLVEHGYEHVYRFPEGKRGWIERGEKLEKSGA